MAYTVLVVITQNKAESLKAVQKALSVAKEAQSSKIRLLYMYPIFSGKRMVPAPAHFQEQLSKESEESFQSVVEMIEKAHIPYEKYVGIGNLVHEVRMQVQLGRCQVLILSSGQLKEVVEDSMDLTRNLTCPVLYA